MARKRDTLEENRNRRVVVSPCDLEEKFQEFSEPNTRKGIETMGLLFGRITEERVVIDKLVFPKQRGTPNGVIMLNDENLDALQVESGLMTVGWRWFVHRSIMPRSGSG